MTKKKRVNRTPGQLLEDQRRKHAVKVLDQCFPSLGTSASLVSSESKSTSRVPVAELLGSKNDAASLSLLLTVANLCDLLQVSRSTLFRMDKQGVLPGRVDLGGHVRYHRQIVEEWLRKKVK